MKLFFVVDRYCMYCVDLNLQESNEHPWVIPSANPMVPLSYERNSHRNKMKGDRERISDHVIANHSVSSRSSCPARF